MAIKVAIANHLCREQGAGAALPMKSQLLRELKAARATAIDPMQFVNLSLATLDIAPDEIGEQNFRYLIQKTFEWIEGEDTPEELLQIALRMKDDAACERTLSGGCLPDTSPIDSHPAPTSGIML